MILNPVFDIASVRFPLKYLASQISLFSKYGCPFPPKFTKEVLAAGSIPNLIKGRNPIARAKFSLISCNLIAQI